MFNKIILVGNIGADAELKANGKMLQFRLATSNRYMKNNEWQEETEWHTVKYWNQYAQSRLEGLKKGRTVLVEGSLTYEEYEGKTYTAIKATSIKGISKLESSSSNGGGGW